ncbi:hypothetical protein, partial [Sinorhizobium meliloti]|uniref:hypothetical protein n=1 Tax=Rhizobium meliloti TaxID=382 RepID=UPI001AED48C6
FRLFGHMNAQQHARQGLIVQKSCQAAGESEIKLLAFFQIVRSEIGRTVEGTICVVRPTRAKDDVVCLVATDAFPKL